MAFFSPAHTLQSKNELSFINMFCVSIFIEQNVLCNCTIESSVKYFLPIQFKQVVFADVDDGNVDVVVVVVVKVVNRFKNCLVQLLTFILMLTLVLMFILMLMSVLMMDFDANVDVDVKV